VIDSSDGGIAAALWGTRSTGMLRPDPQYIWEVSGTCERLVSTGTLKLDSVWAGQIVPVTARQSQGSTGEDRRKSRAPPAISTGPHRVPTSETRHMPMESER
jgi:hypothetical protein